MNRTLERNSTAETKQAELENMKQQFRRGGYEQKELERIERRATEQTSQERTRDQGETLTFPIFFFDGLNSFKKIIKDSSADLQQL